MSYDEDPGTPALIGYLVVGIIDTCMVVGLIAHFAFGWNP